MGDMRRLVLYMAELVSSRPPRAHCDIFAQLAMRASSDFADDQELCDTFERAYEEAFIKRQTTQRLMRKPLHRGYHLIGDDDWRSYFKRRVDNAMTLDVPLTLDREDVKMLREVLAYYSAQDNHR